MAEPAHRRYPRRRTKICAAQLCVALTTGDLRPLPSMEHCPINHDLYIMLDLNVTLASPDLRRLAGYTMERMSGIHSPRIRYKLLIHPHVFFLTDNRFHRSRDGSPRAGRVAEGVRAANWALRSSSSIRHMPLTKPSRSRLPMPDGSHSFL